MDTIGIPENFAFAEQQLEKSQQGEFPRKITFMGRDFILHKDVFSPEMFYGSSVYVPHLPLQSGNSFCEMGCGSGIIAITCCINNNLSRVLCADISQPAVENTLENIKLHHLSDKISVVQSDVFSNIKEDEKFDAIFWNSPYFDAPKKENPTLSDKMMYDPGYVAHKRFILDGYKRLKPNGKLLIGFSTTRFPLEHARKKFQEIGFDANIFYG
jgi:release factor glutamine methyltransferase